MESVSSFFEGLLTIENDAELESRVGDKRSNVLVDRLIERLLSMIIPVDVEHQDIIKERLEIQKSRPKLSMNIMSQNSVALTSRLTSSFMMFDNIIRFFNWANPFLTVGVCLVLTHLILNPYLLSVVPLVVLLNNVLIPHYLVVHPPDRSALRNNPYPDEGPPLAKFHIPGPVPQFSQEYLLNFTDMQNHMVYYVYVYDFVVWLTNDYLYFKNEDLSSLVYLLLLAAMGANLYLLPKVVPVLLRHVEVLQLGAVAYVWAVALVSYPKNRELLISKLVDEDTRVNSLNLITRIENRLIKKFLVRVKDDPTVQELVKEVEIFELQRYNKHYKIWEPVGFTNDFYTINNPLRQLNARLFKDELDDDGLMQEEDNVFINRVPKLVQIKSPSGWEFLSTGWTLDLQPRHWISRNVINDLVDTDNDEKWAYDFYDGDFAELFRRRRWIRYIQRESKIKPTSN